MTNQVNCIILPPQKPNLTTRIQDFMRMNSPAFQGAKVDEDPVEFIDDIY